MNQNIVYVTFVYNNNNIVLKQYSFYKSLNNTIIIMLTILNLIGTLTFYYTITSQFIFTLSISSSIIIMSIINGILVHKWKYLDNLLPSGVPITIAWLIIPIEILSLLSRIISLAVRLSANIISGHTLTHMISDFTSKINNKTYILDGSNWLDMTLIIYTCTFILLSVLSLLEIAIAVLQSYVFTLLVISYINDSFNKH